MKDKRFKVVKGVVKKRGSIFVQKYNYSLNKNLISHDKVKQNKIEAINLKIG